MTFLISFLLFQRVWYPSILLYHISGSQIVRDLFSPLFFFFIYRFIVPVSHLGSLVFRSLDFLLFNRRGEEARF